MIDNKLIQEKLVLGYTLKQIAHMYDLNYGTLRQKYKYVKKDFNYVTNFSKPSYYGHITWESLSMEEKIAYENYEKKNKAYYEY